MIRGALWPMLGADPVPLWPGRRSVDEVREELSRSSWRFSKDGGGAARRS